MVSFQQSATFVQDGQSYELARHEPELAPGSVRRFAYGEEPEVIAKVTVKGGGTVEVHAFAEHYSREWVGISWNDETITYQSCWVPAENVHRPAAGEWQGRFLHERRILGSNPWK